MDEIKKEIFENKLSHFLRAIKTLQYAISESKKHEKSDIDLFSIFRDSVIQRFEYTYELSWKMMKFLWILEWEIEVRTPYQSMKFAFKAWYIDDLDKWFKMKDFRNKSSHEYEENISNDLYYEIFSYSELLQKFYENLKIKYEQWYFKFN